MFSNSNFLSLWITKSEVNVYQPSRVCFVFSVTMPFAILVVVVMVCVLVQESLDQKRKKRKKSSKNKRKQESETEQQSCKSILRRKPFHALFMLFINALCVVCATINSSKNGCFSDYMRNETFFLLPHISFFLSLSFSLVFFFGNETAQQHHPKAKSMHVRCKNEKKENYAHTHQTHQQRQRRFLFLSVLIYTTAHCLVLHFKCTNI